MIHDETETGIKSVGVRVELGSFALNLGDLALLPGITGLVGPNGSGKTTTLRVLAGEIAPKLGHVLFRGRPLVEQGFRLPESVALVPDDLHGIGKINVRSHLAFLASVYSGWDNNRALELCDKFELTTDRRLCDLSRGNRMKLAFISVEAAKPAVLLLDEPTAGLDPFVRQQLLEVLRLSANADPNRTFLLSTHLLEDLMDIAHEIILLSAGNIVRHLDRAGVDVWKSSAAASGGSRLAGYLAALGEF